MSPVAAAACIVFLEGLVVWAVIPVTHAYTQSLGGGPAIVGLMFALMSAPKAISNPVFGRLSDRFGRRPLLIIATLGTITASATWALAAAWPILAISRTLAGLFGAQAALAPAIIADSLPQERRAGGMGLLGAAFSLSMVIGPLIVAQLQVWIGLSGLGWYCVALQIASLLVILLLLRETRPTNAAAAHATPTQQGSPPMPASFWRPVVVSLLLAAFLVMFASHQVTPTVGDLLEGAYGFATAEVPYMFAFLGLVGAVVQGGLVRLLAPIVGERQLVFVGVALAASGMALLALLPPAWGLWVALAAIASGLGFSTPALQTLLSNAVLPTQQGFAQSLNQAMTALGRGVGSIVAGVVLASAGLSAVYALGALAMLLVAPLIAWWSLAALPAKPTLPNNPSQQPA